MASRSSRVVFVGNIPYDLTEPQLIDIFKEVGPVVSFRLVFDRETGKPKGYGFCTFQDSETAGSAVRNLNNYDVGGRQLRIDFAESDKEDMGTAPNRGPPASEERRGPPPMNSRPQPVAASSQPSVEVINQTLATYPPDQMLEVLSQMKHHIDSNPDQVRNLLSENPQLSYALFQSLLVMNVVEPAIMQRILQTQGGPPASARAPSNPVFPSPMNSIPTNLQPAPHQLGLSIGNAPQVALLEEQQRQLLVHVLNLTPDQIQAMPPDQREKIALLRAQILGQS
ncbi:hypothetical protein DFS34DRAFT_36885 [Phlyctochytrium arcticum]|nr:hypothetical protein DFS34DRAFT_36885 [Phlyctochytrium arcticum]